METLLFLLKNQAVLSDSVNLCITVISINHIIWNYALKTDHYMMCYNFLWQMIPFVACILHTLPYSWWSHLFLQRVQLDECEHLVQRRQGSGYEPAHSLLFPCLPPAPWGRLYFWNQLISFSPDWKYTEGLQGISCLLACYKTAVRKDEPKQTKLCWMHQSRWVQQTQHKVLLLSYVKITNFSA